MAISTDPKGRPVGALDGKEADRARGTLLTVGALYFVPISVGLKVEGFGPLFLLMLGLAAVAISKVVHLREAVTDTDCYPPQLVIVDLLIILSLLVMFQLLARPYTFGAVQWHPSALVDLTKQDALEASFVRGAKLFWCLIIVLFIFLIPLWTWVSWRYQGLLRHGLWRYILGWTIGAVLGGYMLHLASTGTASELIEGYKHAGPVSLVSLVFLAAEVLEGSKFERRDARSRVSTSSVGTVARPEPAGISAGR